MLAAMLAALMSSLTSSYNGSSSMFSMDVWTHLRPTVSLLYCQTYNDPRLFVAENKTRLSSTTPPSFPFPQADEREKVVVGRIFGLFMVGASVGWLPILQEMQGGQLWDYLQSIQSYVTPPWVVAFVLGIFWKRCTEQVLSNSAELLLHHRTLCLHFSHLLLFLSAGSLVGTDGRSRCWNLQNGNSLCVPKSTMWRQRSGPKAFSFH